MLWTPPKKPVNVNRMIIYSLIPFLGIYAAWRIQIIWALLIDTAIGFGHSVGSEIILYIMPLPYNIFLGLAIALSISAVVTKHYEFPRLLSLLYIAGAGIMTLTELWPTISMLSIPLSIIISIFVIRFRAIEYNKKIIDK